MALPRKFWMIIGWVIALTTLAAAFGTVRDAYTDLQSLEQCGTESSLSRTLVCSRYRLIEAGAQVAVLVARIPAIGLALIAASFWWGHKQSTPEEIEARAALAAAAKNSKDQAKQAKGAKGTPDSRDAKPAKTSGPRATKQRKVITASGFPTPDAE